jgi:hypothetical protein
MKLLNTIIQRIQELENIIIGKKPDLVVESLQLTNKLKDIEIAELKKQIEQLQSNKSIMRLAALLEHEDIKEKFEAFLNINEKVKYYKKYEYIEDEQCDYYWEVEEK